MAATITCPFCGHKSCPAQQSPGQEVQCPACLNLFPIKPPAPSLLARTAPAEPAPAGPAPQPNRTLLAQPEAMIRYTCPRCKKSLESPASFAGQKLNCPDCNQRLQIPQPSTPPLPPLNKTILASEESAGPPASQTSAPRPQPAPTAVPSVKVEVVEVVEDYPPTTDRASPGRESCLECGVGLARRARVQTCPDCGALFCSAACYREHRYYAHAPKRKKRRPRNVECDRCGSTARPFYTDVISEGGWITFAILLVVFFPICWIGLLQTETRVTCADCGARLD
jgi:hypothetical protein